MRKAYRESDTLLECKCGNPEFGFNCVCDFVEDNPGSIDFTCEFCGIYTAGKARCNKCEADQPSEDLSQYNTVLLCCKYCGNPFTHEYRHSTCGLE